MPRETITVPTDVYESLEALVEQLKIGISEQMGINRSMEVWHAVAVERQAQLERLRIAADRLQAYADAHPCDHMPPCRD